MSIDQSALSFKHTRPSAYATTCPLIVSTFGGGSDKATLTARIITIELKPIDVGRFTVKLYAVV